MMETFRNTLSDEHAQTIKKHQQAKEDAAQAAKEAEEARIQAK